MNNGITSRSKSNVYMTSDPETENWEFLGSSFFGTEGKADKKKHAF